MADEAWFSQVKRGLLEMCILNVLARENMHGYRLAKSISAVRGLVVTEGTIYPLLSRLKEEGLVVTTLEESTQGPARKVYKLSAKGKIKREEMNHVWRQVVYAVDVIAGGLPLQEDSK